MGVGTAQAGVLTLTADGANLGFTLTTFATLNPGYENTGNAGPFGVAYAGNNSVLVSNFADNTLYSFTDADGQTPATANNTLSGLGTGSTGMASLDGVAYGSIPNGGNKFGAYNSDGTLNHVLTGVPQNTFLGMAGDSVRGTIIATSSGGLIEIDPTANGGLGSSRLIANVYPDGVSISPDGQTVYADVGGQIVGYDIQTGAVVYSGPFIPGLDGTGVIVSASSLNGDILAISNFGFVDLVDPVTSAITEIANNGSRGDYGMQDPSNGTLLIDMSEAVYRLACGADCFIGPPPPSTVPEPGSLALLGSALAGAWVVRRRRGQG